MRLTIRLLIFFASRGGDRPGRQRFPAFRWTATGISSPIRAARSTCRNSIPPPTCAPRGFPLPGNRNSPTCAITPGWRGTGARSRRTRPRLTKWRSCALAPSITRRRFTSTARRPARTRAGICPLKSTSLPCSTRVKTRWPCASPTLGPNPMRLSRASIMRKSRMASRIGMSRPAASGKAWNSTIARACGWAAFTFPPPRTAPL